MFPSSEALLACPVVAAVTASFQFVFLMHWHEPNVTMALWSKVLQWFHFTMPCLSLPCLCPPPPPPHTFYSMDPSLCYINLSHYSPLFPICDPFWRHYLWCWWTNYIALFYLGLVSWMLLMMICSDWNEMKPQSSFNLQFSVGWTCWSSFQIFIGCLYFLWEMSIQY